MKILLAEHAGFCWGVKRVVNLSWDLTAKESRPIFSYGPLIHNNAVIEKLVEKGITVMPTDDLGARLDALPDAAIVIIRAHGVPPNELNRFAERDIETVDGTCPHVIQIQKKVDQAFKAGRFVIIIGDKGHAEVTGLLGYCPERGCVVSSVADLDSCTDDMPITVVCQSTLDEETFAAVTAEITKRFSAVEIEDTRCNATTQRQNETISLCTKADVMVVIGGRNSANTNRLAQICRNQGKKTIHVETAEELDPSEFKHISSVGVTAGASTPDWIINQIVETLKMF
jgi:(E)-4-hydroxy-3-methyl-but-2-enyl pyrophosphate reductase